METGSELSKTVAIFIIQKILLDETGLVSINIGLEMAKWSDSLVCMYVLVLHLSNIRAFLCSGNRFAQYGFSIGGDTSDSTT